MSIIDNAVLEVVRGEINDFDFDDIIASAVNDMDLDLSYQIQDAIDSMDWAELIADNQPDLSVEVEQINRKLQDAPDSFLEHCVQVELNTEAIDQLRQQVAALSNPPSSPSNQIDLVMQPDGVIAGYPSLAQLRPYVRATLASGDPASADLLIGMVLATARQIIDAELGSGPAT